MKPTEKLTPKKKTGKSAAAAPLGSPRKTAAANDAKRVARVQSSVNTDWFKSQLAEKGISIRQLAIRHMQLDPSAVSLMLHGLRKPQLDEAARLAEVLDQPIETVLEAFGVSPGGLLGLGAAGGRALPLEGWLDGTLTLRREGLRGKKATTCPFPDRDIHVARFQTAGTEFAGWDGAMCFYRMTKRKGVDHELLGRAAMVQIAGETELKLREVRRGYAPGLFNLAALSGRIIEEGVRLDLMLPVVWLKL